MAREKHISGERQRSVRRLTLIACPAGVYAMERQTGLGWRQGRNVGKQSCPFEHFRIRVRFTRRPYRLATGKILQRRKTKPKVSWPLRRLTSMSLSFSALFRAIRPIAGRTFRVRRRSHNSDVGTTRRWNSGTPDDVIQFYVDAFKKTMEDPASIEQHKKAGLSMSFMDNKELGELIKKQEVFCRDEIAKLYK